MKWRTDRLQATIMRADTLLVEVANLDDSKQGAQAFAAAARGTNLRPLLQRVPAADRPALSDALKRAGLDADELATTDTWAAALIIANLTMTGDRGASVDRALLESGLPVIGLEGYAAQFALFDRLTPEDQADLLRLTIAEIDTDGRAAQIAWLTGDLDALARNELAGVMADPGLYQALMVDRNRAWAAQIAEMMEGGRHPLVAVGAGHMIGDEGLPALLTDRGYTVRRIQ